MGYIKEPVGVDFIVDPTPLTLKERKRISEIIAKYKVNGKKMPTSKLTPRGLVRRSKGNKKIALNLINYDFSEIPLCILCFQKIIT